MASAMTPEPTIPMVAEASDMGGEYTDGRVAGGDTQAVARPSRKNRPVVVTFEVLKPVASSARSSSAGP